MEESHPRAVNSLKYISTSSSKNYLNINNANISFTNERQNNCCEPLINGNLYHNSLSKLKEIVVTNIMPKKSATATASTSKAAMMEEDANRNTRHEPQQPDIFRQEPPLPVKKPRGPSLGLRDLLRPVGFFISTGLGIATIPFLAGSVLVFVVLPRLLIKAIIWGRYRSQGIRLLPISSSVAAAGYEFYTVVLILRGDARMDKIRAKFQALLETKKSNDEGSGWKYPALRRRLVQRLGFYCWEERKKIDLGNHVSLVEEEDQGNGEGISQSRLFELLQSDFKYGSFKVMRADAPQWEALVIPRFQYDVHCLEEEDGLVLLHQEMEPSEVPDDEEYYAVAFRAHSAILDKTTALTMFQEEFVDKKKPSVAQAPSLKRTKEEKFGLLDKLLITGYSLVLIPWVFVTRIVSGLPFSFGENKLDKKKEFHLHSTRTMSLAGFQAAKNVSRTTITSVITACAGGAARNMLLSQDKPLPTEIRFSLKQFCPSSGSHSVYNCVLPSEMYAYPLDRLGHAWVTVAGSKHHHILMEAKKRINAWILWVIGSVPAKSGRQLYKWFHNVHILLELWDLGGRPFQLFGDTVVDLFAWNGLDGTWADFGLTMTTYAGRLKANIIGDNQVLGFGTKMRKNIIADEFLEEYTQIAMPCDIKPKYLYKPIVIGADELF